MIGIRREDKNVWERRAPLTPDHVAELTKQRVQVRVQPSSRRVFPDIDYAAAGATVHEDLSPCSVILGVKEIPADLLLPDKPYVFFSHTTKGQAYNMPLLRRLMERRDTLIDYERILDGRGKRLIFFGRHAGYAGMIDTLWALGRRLAAEGHATPFERVRLAHDYSSLDEATHHISRIGEVIRHTGVPVELDPIVCGFTGSGNVTRGALEIFERLPTLEVSADELPDLAADTARPHNVLYLVRFDRASRYERIDGGPTALEELESAPERYRSGIARWLERLTLLVHGAFWTPLQPRLVENDHLAELWSRGPARLRVIADISMDIEGAVEATVRATDPGDPVYLFDAARRRPVDGITGNGPLILAVDNLPCQLAAESSQHFGDALIRFAPALDRCDWTAPLAELALPAEMTRAVVVHHGALAPDYANLRRHLETA